MKKSMAVIGMMAAAMGMAAAPVSQMHSVRQQEGQQQDGQQRKQNDAAPNGSVTIIQGQRTALNPAGGYYLPPKRSTPPTEYGQWLQSTGRQKWNKRTKNTA